jgi:choline-sulfatase
MQRLYRTRKTTVAVPVWTLLIVGVFAWPIPAVTAGERPSIVLVTVDTLRADRLSSFGYERPTSPNIDRLLETGVRFSHARTIEPLTNPALSSMLTGVAPEVHGATRNGIRMRKGLESLPGILARNGWHTAAFVSNWTLKANVSGLAEHFDEYVEVFTRKRWFGLINSEATAENVTSEAIDWARAQIKDRPDTPFLLWVHYVEPHAPYRFQKKFAGRLGIEDGDPSRSDRYDTEIAAVDHEIGRLLDFLREQVEERDTLLFFAADHGESLGERGYWGHGRNLHEPALRIPMGFTWHGHIPAGTVAAPALILDLAPTVLDLLEIPIPEDFSGTSWAGVMNAGEAPAIDRAACFQAHKGAVHGSHDSDRARNKGLISVGYVLRERKEILRVENDTHMVFDLNQDPQELHNLATPDTQPSQELLQCVGAISEGLGALDRLVVKKLSPEDVERLRALGYLE